MATNLRSGSATAERLTSFPRAASHDGRPHDSQETPDEEANEEPSGSNEPLRRLRGTVELFGKAAPIHSWEAARSRGSLALPSAHAHPISRVGRPRRRRARRRRLRARGGLSNARRQSHLSGDRPCGRGVGHGVHHLRGVQPDHRDRFHSAAADMWSPPSSSASGRVWCRDRRCWSTTCSRSRPRSRRRATRSSASSPRCHLRGSSH